MSVSLEWLGILKYEGGSCFRIGVGIGYITVVGTSDTPLRTVVRNQKTANIGTGQGNTSKRCQCLASKILALSVTAELTILNSLFSQSVKEM